MAEIRKKIFISFNQEQCCWNHSYRSIRGGIHIIFFLFLDENICCRYSLEVPRQGTSNEYQQHMFSLRNKEDISIFQMKKSALSVAMSWNVSGATASCIFCASAFCQVSPLHVSMTILTVIPFETDLFVCVEVLRLSQPNGVMSSAVILHNHTCTWLS